MEVPLVCGDTKQKRPFRVQRGGRRAKRKDNTFGDLCSWAGCVCDTPVRHTYVLQTWTEALLFHMPGRNLGLELKAMEPLCLLLLLTQAPSQKPAKEIKLRPTSWRWL